MQAGKAQWGGFTPPAPISVGGGDPPCAPGCRGGGTPTSRPSRSAGGRHQNPHPRDMTMELPPFADEAALFDWVAKTLYAAVLSDACDAMGYRDRALAADIRPLDESQVLVGRAKTVVWAPIFHVPSDPYEKEIAAVD